MDRLGQEVMEVANGGHVDLLFLSHLDSDHVNGVDRLLALTTVGEVVLPLLPLSRWSTQELLAVISQQARFPLRFWSSWQTQPSG